MGGGCGAGRVGPWGEAESKNFVSIKDIDDIVYIIDDIVHIIDDIDDRMN